MADSITRSSLQAGLLGTEKPTGSNYINNGYHVLMLTSVEQSNTALYISDIRIKHELLIFV